MHDTVVLSLQVTIKDSGWGMILLRVRQVIGLIIMPRTCIEALSNAAIRPSICLSVICPYSSQPCI